MRPNQPLRLRQPQSSRAIARALPPLTREARCTLDELGDMLRILGSNKRLFEVEQEVVHTIDVR
jgi:hypothetical protein